MRKIIIFLLLVSFPFNAFAHEIYAVKKPDGSVTIVNYYPGIDTLEQVIKEHGFTGYPIIKITKDDLPYADKTDREFWAFNDVPIGKKIKVDTDKKASKEAKRAQKQAEIDAVLIKLKVTEDEVKKLKDVLK